MANICFNGKFSAADKAVLTVTNRSYRYGDGLFETMKMINGNLQLAGYHFERLFSSIALLKMDVPGLFTREIVENKIIELCRLNKCDQLCRVRLSVFRGNGGLYDDDRNLQYIIECWPLSDTVNRLNENGLVIDIYPDAAKSTDLFSNLKSANFLPYTMAAVHAREQKLNDCLVLNTSGRIADSTIANIFLVTGSAISTPALQEGCVNGVMRRYLLERLREGGYEVTEKQISADDLLLADELFLSNAINGIRWVQRFRDKLYSMQEAAKIYQLFFQTIQS